MARRFGADFTQVRVHTDATAGAAVRAMGAAAVTLGSDVFFAPGRFAPHTARGRLLLAHELAHVLQQRGAPAEAEPPARPVESAEWLAGRAAVHALAGTPVPALAGQSRYALQCAGPDDDLARLPSVPAGSGMSAERRAELEKAELVKKALDQAITSGGEPDDRAALAAELKERKIDAATWYAGIVPRAAFLGIPIKGSRGSIVPGVHQDLLTVLQSAQQNLMEQYPGKTPREVAKAIGVYEIKGLRPPKKAGKRRHISMHCFGMAVDINYRGNPWIAQPPDNATVRMIERATLLMQGTSVNVRALPETLSKAPAGISAPARVARATRAGQIWDRLHDASEAVKAYLSLGDAELASSVTKDGHGHDLAWWRERLAEDRKLRGQGEFAKHADPAKAGFMDLRKELVEALVTAGLTWGGCYDAEGMDLMHFDLRTGKIKGRPVL